MRQASVSGVPNEMDDQQTRLNLKFSIRDKYSESIEIKVEGVVPCTF